MLSAGRVFKAFLWISCLACAASFGAVEDSDGVPGHRRVGRKWIPNEPLASGRVRVTGLEHKFPPMKGIEDNPITPAKVELGRMLFFDPIVSADNTTSCAHCHHPDHGLADGRALSMGFGATGIGPERSGGKPLPRNAPSLWNAAFNDLQYADGRAEDLETQANGPITHPDEMGADPDQLIAELRAIDEYGELFDRAFGAAANSLTYENVRRALASFERTLLSFSSEFDRYAAGEFELFDEQEMAGMRLFRSLKTRCFECHTLPTFSGGGFRALGVPEEGERDPGRSAIVGFGMPGKFKAPSLRNVELTAPYMHNGAFATLEEVVTFYSEGGGRRDGFPSRLIDDKIQEFELGEEEKASLVAFLKTLTDASLTPEVPKRVPSGLPVVEVSGPSLARVESDDESELPEAFATGAARLSIGPPKIRRFDAPTIPGNKLNDVQHVDFGRLGSRHIAEGGGNSLTSEAEGPEVQAVFSVLPGQSIADAIERAQPGDRIEVHPGAYSEFLSIETDGVSLIGLTSGGARPVLDGLGENSIAIRVTGAQFIIEGFTIRKWLGGAIALEMAPGARLRDLSIRDCGDSPIVNHGSGGVVIERSRIVGGKEKKISHKDSKGTKKRGSLR